MVLTDIIDDFQESVAAGFAGEFFGDGEGLEEAGCRSLGFYFATSGGYYDGYLIRFSTCPGERFLVVVVMLGGGGFMLLYDVCYVEWEFSEAGAAVFLDYPGWIWGAGFGHGGWRTGGLVEIVM